MNRTTESKMFSPSKVMNKSIVSVADNKNQQNNQPVKKCYEEQLAKKIYKDIVGSAKDETAIEKLQLVEHILKNKKILKVLGLTESELNKQILKQHSTKS